MDDRALLEHPHLTIVSGEPDADLRQLAQLITHRVIVDSRSALERVLGRLLAAAERGAAVVPKTLDLIGHTRAAASLLAIGDWVIDAASPTTTAFFRGLAEHDVLPRLGIYALRLLGCGSAGTPEARATICKLGELLGIEVYGASQLLYAAHYDAGGFRDGWRFLLVGAGDLRRDACAHDAVPAGDPYPRILDVDALPAAALPAACPWPRRIATAQAARQILALVRRHGGARMPGLLTTPMYELALPSPSPGAYHIAHVLLGGEFVRVYPDGPVGDPGDDAPDRPASGIVFPVEDAGALRRIMATLPPALA
jgi:hypothetical protein